MMGAVTDLDELRARHEARETANDTFMKAFRSLDGDAHTALEVARQNVKLMTTLRVTQLEHGGAIAGLVTEVRWVKDDIAEVKADMAALRSEVKADMAALRSEVKADVAELRSDVGEIKVGLAEVLRRLPE
jgi:hypothetical protein